MQRNPFRAMDLQDKKDWDPDDWTGLETSRDWSQKLNELHETQTVSSQGMHETAIECAVEPLLGIIPEMSNLVLMPESFDGASLIEGERGDPVQIRHLHEQMDALIADSTRSTNTRTLHAQMDALLAESSSSRLSVEQETILKRAELKKMQGIRQVPALQPGHGLIPPPSSNRRPEHFDEGFFSFRCFRACS